MNGWQRRPLPELPHLQQVPPELMDRILVEHLKEVDARQDAIAERIRHPSEPRTVDPS